MVGVSEATVVRGADLKGVRQQPPGPRLSEPHLSLPALCRGLCISASVQGDAGAPQLPVHSFRVQQVLLKPRPPPASCSLSPLSLQRGPGLWKEAAASPELTAVPGKEPLGRDPGVDLQRVLRVLPAALNPKAKSPSSHLAPEASGGPVATVSSGVMVTWSRLHRGSWQRSHPLRISHKESTPREIHTPPGCLQPQPQLHPGGV